MVSPGGALEALRKAKDEGLIGHIGITSHSLDVLDRAVDDELFDTVMVCFSFLEPEAREKVIPKALERNIGVIAMKPFSGGVIDNARLALKWALAEPGVLVIAGVEQPAALRRELAGLPAGRPTDRGGGARDRGAAGELRQGLLPALRLLPALLRGDPHPDRAGRAHHGEAHGQGPACAGACSGMPSIAAATAPSAATA